MFNITKHYFDGIDDAGNAFIIYAAELQVLFIKIPFSSVIFSNHQNQIFERSFLKKAVMNVNQHHTEIALSDFISGKWENLDERIQENLLNEKNNHLNWNCHMPKAKFSIDYQHKKFSGYGYHETLTMNFAPWKLPISVLKWGRFLSENHSIIWIEWIGEKPLKNVYWNGKRTENTDISDSGIIFQQQNAQLIFEKPVVIKNEKLKTLADRFPFVKLFFKEKFLESMESKYKSVATLSFGNAQETGTALYETVTWNK